MADIKTGGQAFPRPWSDDRTYGDQPDGNKTVVEQDGMTLRDYMAGQALASTYCAIPSIWNDSLSTTARAKEDKAWAEDMAERAYELADAMIAHRNKHS